MTTRTALHTFMLLLAANSVISRSTESPCPVGTPCIAASTCETADTSSLNVADICGWDLTLSGPKLCCHGEKTTTVTQPTVTTPAVEENEIEESDTTDDTTKYEDKTEDGITTEVTPPSTESVTRDDTTDYDQITTDYDETSRDRGDQTVQIPEIKTIKPEDSTDTTVCDREITGTSGTVTSPGYPSSYAPGMDCTTIIRAPEGNTIKLIFTRFDIDKTQGCNYDYLEIRDGDTDTSPIIETSSCINGKYCGKELPSGPTAINTTGNALYCKFVSDEKTSGPGFAANWFAVSEESVLMTFDIILSPPLTWEIGYTDVTSNTFQNLAFSLSSWMDEIVAPSIPGYGCYVLKSVSPDSMMAVGEITLDSSIGDQFHSYSQSQISQYVNNIVTHEAAGLNQYLEKISNPPASTSGPYEACDSNSDCPDKYYCSYGVSEEVKQNYYTVELLKICEPQVAAGNPCVRDDKCVSGNCKFFICSQETKSTNSLFSWL